MATTRAMELWEEFKDKKEDYMASFSDTPFAPMGGGRASEIKAEISAEMDEALKIFDAAEKTIHEMMDVETHEAMRVITPEEKDAAVEKLEQSFYDLITKLAERTKQLDERMEENERNRRAYEQLEINDEKQFESSQKNVPVEILSDTQKNSTEIIDKNVPITENLTEQGDDLAKGSLNIRKEAEETEKRVTVFGKLSDWISKNAEKHMEQHHALLGVGEKVVSLAFESADRAMGEAVRNYELAKQINDYSKQVIAMNKELSKTVTKELITEMFDKKYDPDKFAKINVSHFDSLSEYQEYTAQLIKELTQKKAILQEKLDRANSLETRIENDLSDKEVKPNLFQRIFHKEPEKASDNVKQGNLIYSEDKRAEDKFHLEMRISDLDMMISDITETSETKIQEALQVDIASKKVEQVEKNQDKAFAQKFNERFEAAREGKGVMGVISAAIDTYNEIKRENELEMIRAREAYREVKKENGGLTLGDRIGSLVDHLKENKLAHREAEEKDVREDIQEDKSADGRDDI